MVPVPIVTLSLSFVELVGTVVKLHGHKFTGGNSLYGVRQMG